MKWTTPVMVGTFPDEAVWQQAQQQIKPVFKLGVATWKIASGVFAIAVILTLGSYIWRQNQAVEKLKIELKAQNDKTQQAFNFECRIRKKNTTRKIRPC